MGLLCTPTPLGTRRPLSLLSGCQGWSPRAPSKMPPSHPEALTFLARPLALIPSPSSGAPGGRTHLPVSPGAAGTHNLAEAPDRRRGARGDLLSGWKADLSFYVCLLCLRSRISGLGFGLFRR